MYVPLSKRINPSINSLQYPITTESFRNQITVILVDYIESIENVDSDKVSEFIIIEYYRSTGKSTYNPGRYYNIYEYHNILNSLEDEDFLDMLDITVQIINYDKRLRKTCDYQEFINDINSVLKMNGVDLQIIDGKCIRISEPTIQEEIINPAFIELNRRGFTNAHEELWKAFDFFKNGDNESAILSANKSLEATIDYIMKENGIVSDKDKLTNKMNALICNGILPKEYESCFNSLITTLQTTSVIRNRHGGHGSSDESTVDDLYVQYAIDSAASAILFLSRLYDTYKQPKYS